APATTLRAPAARELHRRLDRLRAAVAQEDALGERVPAEERGQLALDRRVIVVRHVQQLARLPADGLHHRGMAVAQAVHRDPREEVEVAPAVGVPQSAALAARDGERLSRIERDLVRVVAGDDLRARHARASRRRGRRTPCITSVPTPWLVSTSRSSACRARPSITCACLTPPRRASMQHSIFGIMPPSMTPAAIISLASSAYSEGTSLPSRPFTPSTSVSRISFSACSASASLPATTSALMLNV